MSATRPRIPYTYEDYRTLPEDMSRRYELLHGELFMVPAPTTRHQRISRDLEFTLHAYVVSHGLGEILYSPVDVILGDGEEREVAQPDIIFVCAARSGIIKLHGIEGAPELIVEILSPGTEERDRGYKRTLYARHGVREYWLIDPDANTLERYVCGELGFNDPVIYQSSNTLSSALFPGLEIDLSEVLGNVSS